MAQPRAYTQTTNFNDFSSTNPADPHSGANLDTEFTELKQNTDDINANIALLQRDDGKLKNEAVHKDAFDQDALALIGLSGYEVRGAWLTATVYAIGDIVTNNDATYVTSTGHTSDTFSTDIANWTLLANAAINVTGHSVDTFNGIATVQLSGSSWIDDSAAITYTSAVLTPAVGQHITHDSFPRGTKIQSINTGTKVVTADTNSTAAGSGQVVDLGRGFTLSYSYSTDTDFQVFIAGQLTSPTLFAVSGTTLTFTSAPASGTGNVIIWGGGAAVEATKSHVVSHRDDTLDHRDTAQDYATRVGATVRHFDGATNNVSDTSPSAQSGVYSAKEHAEGTTVPEGSAKEWAQTTGAAIDTTYSSKEYAQGAVLAAGGSSKNWAQLATTPTTTATDASAKEWATGVSTHKGDASAKEYATSAQYDSVEGSAEYSAKHYSAQAQDWAVKTTIVRNDANGADVDYSSKEWAAGQLAANTSGSAKQWSIGGGAFVEGTAVTGSSYSAKKYATDSAASASAAATSETNAATSYDNFDDRFLGPHTTAVREVGANVGLDNDGDALVAGAMYFDTTLTIMKVWSGSVWQRMTPTTAEQTNIDAAVADAVDIGKVAALDTEIGRLGATDYSVGASAYLALLGTAAMANSTDGDIKVVADNIVDVNNFAVRYRTGTTDPITALDDGDLFWNQTSDELKIYNTTASAWQVPYLDSASVNAEATNAAISMAIALG